MHIVGGLFLCSLIFEFWLNSQSWFSAIGLEILALDVFCLGDFCLWVLNSFLISGFFFSVIIYIFKAKGVFF